MIVDMKITLEESDLGRIGDILFKLDDKPHSHEEAQDVWDNLPRWLQMEAVNYGIGDTVVSDQIYTLLQRGNS